MVKLKGSLGWVAAIVLLVSGLPAWAETPAERMERLEKENAALRARVQALEAAMSEVKQLLGKAPAAPAGGTAAQPAPAAKLPIRSKFDVDFYGYVRLDVARDSHKGSPDGNVYSWASPRGAAGSEAQMSVHARQSRLGVNIAGPAFGSARTSAKFEVDFYGLGTDERKAAFMMRHAYATLEFPKADLSILAGQTWDVVSPLFIPTFDFTVGANYGNLGYRRPQLRLTKGFKLSNTTRIDTQVALARNIGGLNVPAIAAPPIDNGAGSGTPDMQGRVGVTFPGINRRPISFGVSGMWGLERWHAVAGDKGKSTDKWIAHLDATVPVNSWITLTGEAWMGANLQTYTGGIGQGVNPTLGFRSIRASGGWINLAMNPFRRLRFNTGYSLDDPRDTDLNNGDRVRNTTVYGNGMYDITRDFSTGMEVIYFKTSYKGAATGNNLRWQLSMQYNF